MASLGKKLNDALHSSASGNDGRESMSPRPNCAQALSHLRALRRRGDFHGDLDLHFYALQDPIDFSLLACCDCIRGSYMCFVESNVS